MTVGFTPGLSGTIACTDTSAPLALTGLGNQVYIANVGTQEAFVKFGGATVTAVAGGATTAMLGSMCVPPGLAVAFNIGTNTHVAGICATALTTTLRLTRGDGQ